MLLLDLTCPMPSIVDACGYKCDVAHCDVAQLGCCNAVAKTRSIAVPADLEAQLTSLFSKTQIVQKHSRLWISAGKTRVDTALQLTQDYRNIIEGLQVGRDCCSLACS